MKIEELLYGAFLLMVTVVAIYAAFHYGIPLLDKIFGTSTYVPF